MGNIAAGKSTLLEKLVKMPQFRDLPVIHEPVESNPLLAPFYKDPHRIAFAIQTFMENNFYQEVRRLWSQGVKVAITDYGLTEVFTASLYAQGMLDDRQYRAIKIMQTELVVPGVETDYIYLDVPPVECFRRKEQRGRECEKAITVDYLEHLQESYENFAAYSLRGKVLVRISDYDDNWLEALPGLLAA